MNSFEKFKHDQKIKYSKENVLGRPTPSEKNKDTAQNEELKLITKIRFNNGNTYRLYNNGKLYLELPNGKLELVDNLNLKNKALIDKIMSRFKAVPTDIVEDSSRENADNEMEPDL